MAEPGYQSIIYEKKPPIAYITLNEPEKLNRLSSLPLGPRGELGGLLGEFEKATIDIKFDDSIRVFVIKAAGRAFSAGYDIAEPQRQYDVSTVEKWPDAEYWDESQVERCNYWKRCIWDNRKPSIAQVHGYCLAGACHMTCHVDCVICSEDALFGHPAVRFGAVDPQQLWPTLIGMRKAKELLMTGNFMSSVEALRVGFVNKVVPREKLEEEVNKLARSIANMPPNTAYYNKLAVNRWYEIQGLQQCVTAASALDGEEYGSHLPGHLWEFFKHSAELGLKTALEVRDEPFAARDIEIAEENKREAAQLRALYEERMKP